MHILRKTLVGTSTEFTFNVKGTKFLVKNFSTGNIYVNFEPITNDNENTSIKIPKDIAQVVLSNEYHGNTLKADTLYIKGTGEVEVQVICY